MWERIAQLAGAIGTGEPDLLPAQFPFSVGDPWLALELPRLAWRHLNPSSGLDNAADMDCSPAAGGGEVRGRRRLRRRRSRRDRGGRGRRRNAGQRLLGDGLRPGQRPLASPHAHLRAGRTTRTSTAAPDPVAAKFAVAGDFDGDGRDELAVAKDVGGTRGNDLLGDGLRPGRPPLVAPGRHRLQRGAGGGEVRRRRGLRRGRPGRGGDRPGRRRNAGERLLGDATTTRRRGGGRT